MSWELLWKAVLILTIAGYSLLVVAVIIGGVRNIIDMLRDLRKPVDSSEEQS